MTSEWSSQPSAEEGEIMAQKKFLVTGATGDTGGYTVEQLLEREHAVRALAHREDDRSKRLEKMGAEVVIGDLLKFNDVRAAMRGVRGAYFCYPIRLGILQATDYFAQAAKEADLECVVNMSQKSAREDALSHAAQDHWLSEQVLSTLRGSLLLSHISTHPSSRIESTRAPWIPPVNDCTFCRMMLSGSMASQSRS